MTDPAIVAMEAYKEGQVEHQGNRLPKGLESDKEKMMDDLISRVVALEALYDWEMCYDWDEHCREEDPKPAYIISPSDVIEELPSAQPERKKGKWVIYVISMLDGEGCRCSECGFEGVPHWDYCPNCGARMEGIDETD